MPENSAAAPRRPSTALLVLLVAVLGGAVVYMMWPAAVQAPAPSNPPREQRRQARATTGKQGEGETPGALNVQLDALKPTPQAAKAPEDAARNPFRFYVKPPPPPPPPKPVVVAPPPRVPQPTDPDYRPPPPPPIPLKFIGTVEKQGRKVAIFVSNDGKGMPAYAGEGEIVLGQYRVVKIGVESVTVEYLDGRGRQTIPMRG